MKVTGTSKGRGFQGVVKRYGFDGGPNTHGNTKHRQSRLHRRRHGSVARHQGQEDAGPVRRRRATRQISLRVEKIDAERNLIYIRGSVAGPTNGIVLVRKQG